VKKNVASQSIGAEMITAVDGTAFTGAVTVLITLDNGTQSASAGTAPAHEGNGYHSYTPTQAETNGDHIAFTWTGTGAIPATVQLFTNFPQTVDNDTKISLIPTTAMRGTDSAATSAKQDTMETTLNAIPTTPMRGTDGANTTTPPTTAQIWAETTRVLTAGTNIVLAKGVGVTGFNDLSSAQVNAEMLDVLVTDTFAEVTVPASTASIKDMIHYTFSRVKNKTTQTATTLTVRNNSDTGNLGTAAVSDDGTTFTKGSES